jgi:lipopolysaccharide transport system ATP-binding protein
MSDIAIRAENLGKQYRIGKRERYQTLRDTVTSALAAPFRRLRRTASESAGSELDRIWALKDVSFEISRGEVAGIIGRNGAGKSTLLKVLSRITEPTEGRAEICGRVGSLLEVGTGFHPELTGRENIYLNGAILGMRRAEIARKFDEIVAFAEIDKFLDTPVKHYSSGMYMRLAFAVAAHLEPEILIVDEVLAVGDAQFQSKCLNKMQDVGREGRTVLFVSHSMPAVARLCSRALLLDGGTVAHDGAAGDVIGYYLRSGLATSAEHRWNDLRSAPGNEVVRLAAVRVRNIAGDLVETVDVRDPVGIEMEFDVLQPGAMLVPSFHLHNAEGVCLFVVHERSVWQRRGRAQGRYTSTAWVPGDLLADGTHLVTAVVATLAPLRIHFFESDVVAFQSIDCSQGESARGDFNGQLPGAVRPLLEWSTEFIGATAEAAVCS